MFNPLGKCHFLQVLLDVDLEAAQFHFHYHRHRHHNHWLHDVVAGSSGCHQWPSSSSSHCCNIILLQVLLDVHRETSHFWELELWRTKQLPVSGRFQNWNQFVQNENLKPLQCIASTMPKLEYTANQACSSKSSLVPWYTQKSLKIPKIWCDNDTNVEFIWLSCRYENGEKEHCLELWNRDGKVGCLQIRNIIVILIISTTGSLVAITV